MALKGYVDRQAGRDELKQRMLKRHGAEFVPLGGWDAYFGHDDPILDQKCRKCGHMVAEIRPFGKDFMSICEDCAKKDMATYEQMSQGAI
jgi:formylmethanofuran dehydrogenase subunit E